MYFTNHILLQIEITSTEAHWVYIKSKLFAFQAEHTGLIYASRMLCASQVLEETIDGRKVP